MKLYFQNKMDLKIRLHFALLLAGILLSACDREYYYDTDEPSFMNGSIYEYLNTDGNFTYFVRLIEDLNYKDVLNLTGSKTLFVANDSVFNEFFKSNNWSVGKYEDLSLSQKKQIFYFSMINNAYTIEKLSNYYDGQPHEGTAMRRLTALSALDSIPFETQLPKSSYWDPYRSKGLYLLKDNSDIPLTFFSQQFIDKTGMTDTDFSFISGGKTRERNDFHVFNKKVVKRDIACKNGYVHVLDDLLILPVNMAEYVAANGRTTLFSEMLDRFCAPYYDASNTVLYRELHPGFTDSIFNKSYFASYGGENMSPDRKPVPLLAFNPGWNAYSVASISKSTIYPDMAAMFVPTDEAMNNYFEVDPTGILLKERYGSWEGFPENVAISFLKRHMRPSLMESLPSKFSKMVDDQNYPMQVTESDILKEHNYTAINGEVYITNKVYTPVDFISVYGPVLLNANTKVMNWAINRTEKANDGTEFAFYKLYLNSLVVKYGLFIPSDDYFDKYIDPVAYGQTGVQGVMKYWYNEKTASVNATVYQYSKATDEIGDSISVITDEVFLENRLWKLLDDHIVVNDISADGYYITKSNDILKVSNGGSTLQGGFDIQKNTAANVIRKFDQENGSTYILNSPIQYALESVHTTLGDISKSDFSLFFELLSGVPNDFSPEIPPIFRARGVDFSVSFLNAYNYTIYVPSNSAIQQAIEDKVIRTWSEINALPMEERKKETLNMIRFLRYHFQDRAIFIGQSVNQVFDSNTICLTTDQSSPYWGTTPDKYYKLGVQSVGDTFELTTETGGKAKVLLKNGYYNIIAKDFIFNKNETVSSSFKNVDGSGSTSAQPFISSRIKNSSSAVIHLIDNVLTFK